MIAATVFAGRNVALFGLGGSGLATARSLLAGGATVLAFDDNPESLAKAAGEGIVTGDLRQADWTTFDALVLSPGVPLTHPKPHWSAELAARAGVEIIGDIEIFARQRRREAPDAPLIAITGTNGKSTTTALTAHILRSAGRDAQMGGNIGRAALTLDPLTPDPPTPERVTVLECSSYQIDLAPTLDPTAGILLNLTPDHLDRHGTMERYAEIKERLVARSQTAIVGIDDAWGKAIAKRLEAAAGHVVRIARDSPLVDGFYGFGPFLLRSTAGHGVPFASLAGIGSLRGAHNAQNALAASAACFAVGLSGDEIQAGLASFPGLAHRMEQIGRKGAVLFVNDSKATNADAAAPALASFPRIHWIAGGLPKEGGIAPLKGFFPRIAKAYLIGEAAGLFAATIGDDAPFEISGTLEAAVANAARDAAATDGDEAVVLLSPACASFDQFRNFEVRGEAFRQAVLAIPGIEPFGGAR